MGLNLSSLKNLSAVSTKASIIGNILPSPIEVSKISENTTSISENVQVNKTPITGPKISLMKLKKASGLENSVILEERGMNKEVSPENNLLQKELTEMGSSSDLIQLIQKEEIIDTPSEEKIIIPSAEIVITEEVIHVSKESQSIITINEMTESKDIKQGITEEIEQKEFFPNFQIMDTMNLDEDLLDLQDFITIKEHQEPITSVESILITETISPEEVSMSTSPIIIDEENVVMHAVETISPEESNLEMKSAVIISGEPSGNTIITPEYIAEVKTELSEGRRAGFRFFVQKKTKIMAGIGLVVLSISAVALFSGSFLGESIQKSGKSNLQETVQNKEPITEQTNVPLSKVETIPPIETVVPVIIPPMETVNYEMGRDYSVTKNTKKNIRTKTSTDSLTGAEIPTP